jgi:SpoIID/LytB domain protein
MEHFLHRKLPAVSSGNHKTIFNRFINHSTILLCLYTSILLLTPAFAQHIPPVSEAALRGHGIYTPEIKRIPDSETVRAAIGDSAFKNYTYSEISVFGTKEIMVYDNGRLAGKFPSNMPVKFKYIDDELYFYENEHVLPQVLDGGQSGKVEIDCPDGLLGVENLKRAGKQALYRGSFEIIRVNGKFNLINVIEVEDYLKGVVPNEMPVSFGLEALKAQSVAARNYVLAPRIKTSVNYDVVDSVASQVYYGANTERPLAVQAVNETEGITALYNGELILAQYSSTAGGYTESYANVFADPCSKQFRDRPYLAATPDILSQTPLNTEEAAREYYKSKPDSYDIRSPYFRWEREWEAKELKEVLKNMTSGQDIKELKAVRRGNSGKIIELEIVTNGQSYTVQKELAIRRLLTQNGSALPSANVVFEHEYDSGGKLIRIKAFGGGYGHGVGMSQYGAGFMGSELKLPYETILQRYYAGISLGTKPVVISAALPCVTQNFYAGNSKKEKKAVIITDNKSQVSKFIANINGKEHMFELHSGFLHSKKTEETDISEYIKQGRNTIIFYYPPDESAKKSLKLYVELEQPKESIW